MPRGITKKDKIDGYDKLKHERDVLSWALHYSMTDRPAGGVSYSDGDSRYVISLYGATGAHGGIVVVRFQHPGQRDSIEAEYFDDWYRRVEQIPFSGPAWVVDLKECARQLRLRRNDELGIAA